MFIKKIISCSLKQNKKLLTSPKAQCHPILKALLYHGLICVSRCITLWNAGTRFTDKEAEDRGRKHLTRPKRRRLGRLPGGEILVFCKIKRKQLCLSSPTCTRGHSRGRAVAQWVGMNGSGTRYNPFSSRSELAHWPREGI